MTRNEIPQRAPEIADWLSGIGHTDGDIPPMNAKAIVK